MKLNIETTTDNILHMLGGLAQKFRAEEGSKKEETRNVIAKILIQLELQESEPVLISDCKSKFHTFAKLINYKFNELMF